MNFHSLHHFSINISELYFTNCFFFISRQAGKIQPSSEIKNYSGYKFIFLKDDG